MKVAYTLTPKLRTKLKEPFGLLVVGTVEQTMAKMKTLVEAQKPPMIVSVGDVVSHNLHAFGVHPQLTIIDNISMRNQAMPKEASVDRTVEVVNPQGVITEEAIAAVKQALKQNMHTHIIVKGEEDLLTLIAVLYAPLRAFVVYGQPHVGIVVAEVSLEKKARVEGFLNEMKPAKS